MEKIGSNDAGSGKPNLEFVSKLQGIFTDSVLNTLINNNIFVAETIITADAHTVPVTVDIPVGAKIIDAWAISTATVGSAAVTIKDGAGSPATIMAALDIGTDKAVARMATAVDDTLLTVTSTGVHLWTVGANDRGQVFIMYTL